MITFLLDWLAIMTISAAVGIWVVLWLDWLWEADRARTRALREAERQLAEVIAENRRAAAELVRTAQRCVRAMSDGRQEDETP